MPNSLLLEILDVQDYMEIDTEKVRYLCEIILADAGFHSGKIEVVFVDAETSQQHNRDFLQHDYPTDSIAFPMEERREVGYIEGEILACTEIAKERAGEFCWSPEEELMLYTAHGLLHLVGYDDQTVESREIMRQKEKEYLALIGITVPDFDYGPDWEDLTDDASQN